MPAIARVVDNEVRGDGTIETKVLITALHQTSAANRAKNRALLFNGYSTAITSSTEAGIGIEVKNIQKRESRIARNLYEVTTEISGAGEFLEANQ